MTKKFFVLFILSLSCLLGFIFSLHRLFNPDCSCLDLAFEILRMKYGIEQLFFQLLNTLLELNDYNFLILLSLLVLFILEYPHLGLSFIQYQLIIEFLALLLKHGDISISLPYLGLILIQVIEEALNSCF